MTAPFKWSPDEDKLLSKLWEERIPTLTISRRLIGKTANSVMLRARRLGLPPRTNPCIRLSAMPAEERNRRITEGVAKGLSAAAIARSIGFTRQYTQQCIRMLGLVRKPVEAVAKPEPLPGEWPHMPYVPGIVVTGRYVMVKPPVDSGSSFDHEIRP